jgi:hypothetical protein
MGACASYNGAVREELSQEDQIMLENRSGSQWLTREKDVVAHLFFAASEINTVEIELGGQAVLGSISFPSVEAQCFSFFVSDSMDGAVDAPKQGTVVRVRYSRGESVYTYLTAIAEVMDRNRWRLEFPRTIERNEQRIAARHRMGAQQAVGGFRLRLDLDGNQYSQAIYDMSTGGLGFIFDPGSTPVTEGRALAANICMPEGSTIPVLIEIANVRPMGGGRKECIAGCQFIGLASSDHALLARALSDWGRRSGG